MRFLFLRVPERFPLDPLRFKRFAETTAGFASPDRKARRQLWVAIKDEFISKYIINKNIYMNSHIKHKDGMTIR